MQVLTFDEEAKLRQVPLGAIFRHYKGKEYKVLQIARHSEEKILYVIYQGLYFCEKYGEHPIWIRPLKMFLDRIDENTPRFKKISK